ncbi:MAG TPA: amidohydrolase family protein [Armatimonadota bacterium]|nr:amidohydrolase family protein [Armatimonadota bacterium]
MSYPEIEKQLLAAISEFEIIDCHEHIGPEKSRLDTEVDVFTLFYHYTKGDLMAAGMSEEQYKSLFDHSIPLDKRWDVFKPYWEQIRWTSYSRAALLAAEKFYGFDDINKETYEPLSKAIKEANTPGIYERVLRDACNIRTSLTTLDSVSEAMRIDTPLLTPLVWIPSYNTLTSWEKLHHPVFAPEATVNTLDDLLDCMKQTILKVKARGAVGIKTTSYPYREPSRKQAEEVFNDLKNGKLLKMPEPGELAPHLTSNALVDYFVDEIISFVTEQDMTVAVHTGYWGDFRKLDPLHIIPMLQRHPNARFDIFHLGFPWVREALMLGKGFPNVWLNLCWTHIISQKMATSAIKEAIDLIPANKMLAFGGDYHIPVEKVYGHLVMAREDIAKALAERVAEKQMTESQAIDLAHKWFWDNPVELYRLKV